MLVSGSRTEQVARRRAELLDAAYRVVLDRGLSRVRIADVAQAVNVSGGLVHYHFATKDALLTETMRSAAAQDIERLHDIAGGRGSALERLDRVMREYVPAADGDQSWLLWIDAWGAGLRDESLRAISEELDGVWAAALEDVLRDGAAAGEFACADPAASALRLASLLDGLGLRVTLGRRGMSRARMVENARQAAAMELGLPRSAFPGVRRSG